MDYSRQARQQERERDYVLVSKEISSGNNQVPMGQNKMIQSEHCNKLAGESIFLYTYPVPNVCTQK